MVICDIWLKLALFHRCTIFRMKHLRSNSPSHHRWLLSMHGAIFIKATDEVTSITRPHHKWSWTALLVYLFSLQIVFIMWIILSCY
uniref:Uncharacterized protein n=1 Tax=Arundo donax TaxID=35708 RepID=A0A0A9CKC8_ARUDO